MNRRSSNLPPMRVTEEQRKIVEEAARLTRKSISGFSRMVVLRAAKKVVKAYEKKLSGTTNPGE